AAHAAPRQRGERLHARLHSAHAAAHGHERGDLEHLRLRGFERILAVQTMRVAITGLGVVAPGAVGVERFRALLDEGKTAVTEVDRFDTAGLNAHTAAVVRDFKARDFIPAMKMRRMNLLSRYAMAAAKLAVDDAGFAPPNTAGVALGTSFGPVQTSVDYMQ